MTARPSAPSRESLSVWLGVCPGILLGLVAIGFHIDRMPLLEPDEGRNAEVAREMLEARDWIVPRFHGMPYLDKPALYFDSVALSFALFGRSEAASRLPSLFFALGTALATWMLGRRLLGRENVAWSLMVLVTAPLFASFARIVIFDMALTFFVTLALVFAEEGRCGRSWGFPLAWAATGLAVLTKGPVGLLLPVLGTVALSIGRGAPLRLRAYFHPFHLVPFVVLTLPWVLAVEARHPGFLRYALMVETVERLTRPTLHRTGPAYYFVLVLFFGLFPWSFVGSARIVEWFRGARSFARPSPEKGLLLAALMMVLFFSLSSSKLMGYVLPSLPLLALLLGREAARAREHPEAWAWVPGVGLLLFGLVLVGAAASEAPLIFWPHVSSVLWSVIDALLLRTGLVSTLFGLLLVGLGALHRARLAPTLLSLWLPSAVLTGSGPILLYTEQNSSRRLAAEIVKLGGDDVRVAAVRCFPVGLDYYLGRVVPVVTESGEELTSTYVTRKFDELRRENPGALWSSEDLRARLARNEVDLLITRGPGGSGNGLQVTRLVSRYRLWRRAALRD